MIGADTTISEIASLHFEVAASREMGIGVDQTGIPLGGELWVDELFGEVNRSGAERLF